MCAVHYTTSDLRAASDLGYDTIVTHAQKKWLRGELVSRTQGWRFPQDNVERWAQKYLKGEPKSGVLFLLANGKPPPKPEWRSPAWEPDKAHLVFPDGSTPCKVKASQWAVFDEEQAHKCTRCLGHERKKKK